MKKAICVFSVLLGLSIASSAVFGTMLSKERAVAAPPVPSSVSGEPFNAENSGETVSGQVQTTGERKELDLSAGEDLDIDANAISLSVQATDEAKPWAMLSCKDNALDKVFYSAVRTDDGLKIKCNPQASHKNLTLNIQLVVYLPNNYLDELEIDANATNLNASSLSLQKIEVDGNAVNVDIRKSAAKKFSFSGNACNLTFRENTVQGEFSYDSNAGNADITLPAGTGFTCSYEARVGSFKNLLPEDALKHHSKSNKAFVKEGEFSYLGGGYKVEIECNASSVKLGVA